MTVRFGPYTLLRRLAVTGFAEVFMAERRSDGVRVAVKRLLPHAEEDEDIVSLFLAEAELAASLSHENVVQVYASGRVNRSPYIEQEFLQGITLTKLGRLLRERSESLQELESIAMAAQLARGLAYIHGANDPSGKPLRIVHRDLTPGNIMLTASGQVRVLDFGIATYRGREHLTQPGIRKGKVAYMSPEQVRGDTLDYRSDIFAYGVVLTELMTGERLFKEDDVLRTMERIEAADIPSPAGDETLLQSLLRRCLSRARAERPDLTSDILDCLDKHLASESIDGVQLLTGLYERCVASLDELPGKALRLHLPVSAEERGEETTDQKEVSDITLVGESPFMRPGKCDGEDGSAK